MDRTGQLCVRTSGWICRPWRGRFYPPALPTGAWFGHSARPFDTVEINNRFYRLPGENVFAGWRAQAPPGFLYAVKASRFLTLMKMLKDPAESLDRFPGRARLLGPHLGPVLYQLPPGWHRNTGRLRELLALLPRDLRHVVEFRDPSWYADDVRAALTEAGVGLCIHDLSGVASPDWVTGPLVYPRFHGPTRVAYAGGYPREHLRAWADRVRGHLAAGLDVAAYFNNDDQAHAVGNARDPREVAAGAPAAALA